MGGQGVEGIFGFVTLRKPAWSGYFHLELSQACALTTPLFPTAGSAQLVLICLWPLSCSRAPLPAHGAGPAVPVSAYRHPSKGSSSGGRQVGGGCGRDPTPHGTGVG